MNYSESDTASLDNNELCDQCRALAYAITELAQPMMRDVLMWILVEKIEMLSLRFEDEESTLSPETFVEFTEEDTATPRSLAGMA